MMGAYIRHQRRIADLSMRQVSAMVGISNPYLSQIERGLRAPSEAVASSIASALGITVDELYAQDEDDAAATASDPPEPTPEPEHTGVVEAIEQATELSAAQRMSLLEIYRSFVRSNTSDDE
jgi:transcriptional regulator with XRE-family HTH domain